MRPRLRWRGLFSCTRFAKTDLRRNSKLYLLTVWDLSLPTSTGFEYCVINTLGCAFEQGAEPLVHMAPIVCRENRGTIIQYSSSIRIFRQKILLLEHAPQLHQITPTQDVGVHLTVGRTPTLLTGRTQGPCLGLRPKENNGLHITTWMKVRQFS